MIKTAVVGHAQKMGGVDVYQEERGWVINVRSENSMEALWAEQ